MPNFSVLQRPHHQKFFQEYLEGKLTNIYEYNIKKYISLFEEHKPYSTKTRGYLYKNVKPRKCISENIQNITKNEMTRQKNNVYADFLQVSEFENNEHKTQGVTEKT